MLTKGPIWTVRRGRVSGLNDPHKTTLFRHKELVALELRYQRCGSIFFDPMTAAVHVHTWLFRALFGHRRVVDTSGHNFVSQLGTVEVEA